MIITPEGDLAGDIEISLSNSQLLEIYEDMVLSRILDGWLVRLQRMGLVGIHAPSEGQEAAMVGTAYALSADDWIFPLYRELPVFIARGVPVSSILDRALCSVDDCLKGRDFAVYGDIRYRIVPAAIPVGLNIAPAVGFALALKMKGEKQVVMNYFGDGATSKGEFHEALNMAGVFKVPVVFVCQNNQYAISTHVSRQTAAQTLAQKAVAYGFEGVRVDGNDVLACYTAAEKAVSKARGGGGPTLIEAFTYRLGPHTTADDPSRYRSREEETMWRARDPLKRFKNYLIRGGLWSEGDDRALYERLEKMVVEEVERVESKPKLHPSVILDDVYAVPPWYIDEEKQELLEDLKGM